MRNTRLATHEIHARRAVTRHAAQIVFNAVVMEELTREDILGLLKDGGGKVNRSTLIDSLEFSKAPGGHVRLQSPSMDRAAHIVQANIKTCVGTLHIVDRILETDRSAENILEVPDLLADPSAAPAPAPEPAAAAIQAAAPPAVSPQPIALFMTPQERAHVPQRRRGSAAGVVAGVSIALALVAVAGMAVLVVFVRRHSHSARLAPKVCTARMPRERSQHP
jgi:hypothetical protein